MIHHLRHRGTRSRASSGALAAVLVRSTDVCLSPDSGGIADIPQPPLGATSGLTHGARSLAQSNHWRAHPQYIVLERLTRTR